LSPWRLCIKKSEDRIILKIKGKIRSNITGFH
jgi:hypothetical protein